MSESGASQVLRSWHVSAAMALGLALAACGGNEADAPAERAVEELEVSEAGLIVQLYFPGPNGLLNPEERPLVDPLPLDDPAAQPEQTISVADRARQILEELLAGPDNAVLEAPLPAGTVLQSILLTPEGVLFVDLGSPDRSPPPAGGSQQELLTVFSVVDSVLLNLPEIRSVVLLWNGQQRESFAGHIDTTYPLLANTDLVAGPS